MKILQLLSLVSLLLLSCQNRNISTSASQEFPELLMRPQVIGPEEEMGYVLDTYQELIEKIKANPRDFNSRLSLAELFMQEARISGEHGHYFPAALAIVEKVIADNPEEAFIYRAYLDKASVLLSLHQFNEAKIAGEHALKLNNQSADAYGVLTDAYVELGRYEDAIAMADQMVSIRPDLRSYSRVSYLREIHGDVNGAIEAMKMAVDAGYPGMEQTEWARLTLGHIYERYGYLDSALVHFQTALAVRPNFPFAVNAISNIHYAKGNLAVADSLNAVASALIPEVGFFVDKAGWEMDKGNTALVADLTRDIEAMLADDTEAGHIMNLEMARVSLHLKDSPTEALVLAMNEYTDRPDNIDVNSLLAEIYYHQGAYDKAQVHLQKSLATGSKDPALLCLEGMILVKTSDKEKGESILKQVFVDIPYLDCSYCAEARAIII